MNYLMIMKEKRIFLLIFIVSDLSRSFINIIHTEPQYTENEVVGSHYNCTTRNICNSLVIICDYALIH